MPAKVGPLRAADSQWPQHCSFQSGYAGTSGQRPLVSAPLTIHHGSGDYYWAGSQFNFIQSEALLGQSPKKLNLG